MTNASSSNAYPELTTRYAGYFIGDVNITNLLTVNGTTYTSDVRYKTNIQSLNQDVFSLNPVKYNYIQRFIPAVDSLGNAAEIPVFDENSQLFQKKHFGLVAQEVKELFPDLVYSDSAGYLSVDYIGIIPLLIQSVKDLKAEVEELKSNQNVQSTPMNAPARTQAPATLFQNVSNPFNENSEIAFYLPENIKNAMLCVYDMNGKQLSQTIIKERGNSTFVINGRSYGAGMYLYSLIADSQVVDTKRMILTK